VAYLEQFPRTTLVRIGYDLFDEVRKLPGRSAGQKLICQHGAAHFVPQDLITGAGIPLAGIPAVPDGYRFIACLTLMLIIPQSANTNGTTRCSGSCIAFRFFAEPDVDGYPSEIWSEIGRRSGSYRLFIWAWRKILSEFMMLPGIGERSPDLLYTFQELPEELSWSGTHVSCCIRRCGHHRYDQS
jgi:hypothetical protein